MAKDYTLPEESRIETAEPWIEQDRLVAESDLPSVGSEPLEIHACGTGPPALGSWLRPFSHAGEQERLAQAQRGAGYSCGQPAA